MFRFLQSAYRYGYVLLSLLWMLATQCIHIAVAEEAPNYSDLLRQALVDAPVLVEQAANIRAVSADARQAEVFLNPNINGMTENLNAAARDNQPRQDTLMITQPFEIGGKRAARIEARRRDVTVAETREKQIRVNYAAELATAYANAEAMRNRLDITGDDSRRALDDLKAVTALVNAGREARLRLSQAQANAAAAQAAEQSAQANFTEALERLSAISGAREPFTSVPDDFISKAMMTKVDRSQTSDEVTPAIASAQTEKAALEAQVQFEEKRWLPTVGFSAGVRRFESSNDNALVFAISSDIPVFDQNKGGIAAARERVLAADARLDAARLMAGANHRSALSHVLASEKRMDAASQGEAAASEAYRLGKIGYETGKTSLMELLLIRKSLTDARLLTVDAQYSLVKALAILAASEGRIAFGDIK
ncbi:MAG: TolC family protein [Methylophilus sp.]|nr:TolC family protein [Methylophilus sp.]